jgi:prepilin peptidase CpaA
MGAGDVKLMGAIGAILGPKGVFLAFLFTAVLGGMYALVLLVGTWKYVKGFAQRWGTMLKTLVFVRQLHHIPPVKSQRKPKLRYGVVIALGTMCSVVWRLAGKTFPI